ncbi:hypothetical protein ACFV4E_38170 [Streptomyces hygroscopicus]|uniref:hypothetical protein n=1 Tax=Streptomyces hygroscopicus TaxID=1912 RepID=UPI00369A389C
MCAIPLRTQGVCDRATRASSPAPTPTRPPLAAFTEPDRPKDLLIRFITVSDSHVDVTGPGQHSDKNRWNCHGCGDSSDRPEQDYLFRIRPNANSHAAACRAIPLR